MTTRLILLAVGLVASPAPGDNAVADGDDLPDKRAARFKITTRRPDDRIEVHSDPDTTVFAVRSPFGIGRADIERLGDRWPQAVALRLYLRGLEDFRISNGRVTLGAAASVREGKPQVRLWADGGEDTSLDEKSPLWTEIRILGDDGRPATEIPLKGGYFEMTLPRALFEGNPKSITLNWIDFYRQ